MKILIVDDNTENLYLLETLLKSQGHAVITATDGARALASALDNPPDMIISDILMPVMDGFELCRQWKTNQNLRHIPFIVYTATYTDLKDEQLALSLGADRFIIKPQQPEVLIQIIGEVLNEFNSTGGTSTAEPIKDEKKILLQYNEVLFHKLEKKIAELEAEIAKQKQTEIALRESERKYQELISQSPDGIFVADLNGRFLSVNRIMCEKLKYSKEELLSMSIWDIVPQQYIEQHKRRIADIMAGKAPNEAAEYSVTGRDGQIHYIEILSAPHYDRGKLIGFQGIARDICERKKAEQMLKESEQKYRDIFENAIEGIYRSTVDGKFQFVNPAFASMCGYSSPAEMLEAVTDIGRQLYFNPSDRKQLLDLLSGSPERKVSSFETRFRRKDGAILWVSLNARLVNVEENDFIECTCMDITARRQAEEELYNSYGKLKNTLSDAIDTMARIAELRDPYTAGHQKNVALLATAIARELNIDEETIEQLKMAANIHDIGKMYIPSDILSKPGKLTSIEMELIKTHSERGYEVIKGMEFPVGISQSILEHHERLDGSGYPKRLKGPDISREAKILAVADVVEAMTSHRPYRAALGINKALEEIINNSGKLYDPAAVDACVRLFKEKRFSFD